LVSILSKQRASPQRLEKQRHIWREEAKIYLLKRVAGGMVEWLETHTTKSRRQEELDAREEIKAEQPRFRRSFSA
jgi:hypothetical protein